MALPKTGDKVTHATYGIGIVTWVYRSSALIVDFESSEREVAGEDVSLLTDTSSD